MSDTKSLGQQGESLATEHLKGKGYSIRHRNWKSGNHEVDIIAETNDFVVFVEVKTRSEKPFVPPKESLSRTKLNAIIYCADNYIRKYNINKQSRFDIIYIEAEGEGFRIEHIEDAYYPTLR